MILVEQNFGSDKFGLKKVDPKNYGSKKNLGKQIFLDHTIAGQKNWGQQNFGSKKILIPKNVGPKSF